MKLLGEPDGRVTNEGDIYIFKITNPETQTIEVTFTKDGHAETIEYDLERLVCEVPDDAMIGSDQDPIRDYRHDPIRGDEEE